MKEAGYGRIVNISSGAGRSVSLTGIQAYASAKAGQIGFTRQTAHELGPLRHHRQLHRTRLRALEPDQRAASGRATARRGSARCSSASRRGGWETPEDIANGVLFFVAEESSWVTGQVLSIDGGHSIF